MNERITFSAPCFNFIDGMLRQISNGLRGYDGRIVENLEAMSGVFAKACLRDDLPLALTMSGGFTVPNRLLELQKAYLKWLTADREYAGSGGKLYPVVELLPLAAEPSTVSRPLKAREFEDDGLQVLVTKNRKVVTRPSNTRKKMKGLTLAIALAEDNIDITSDRIAALRFLDSVWGRGEWPNPQAGAEYRRAYDMLWANRSRFVADLMALVLMQGDASRVEALRQRIYTEKFGERMSVMHYFGENGVHPGQWLEVDEQTFRSEVKEAAERPFVESAKS
jgi:hypothetical protein